MEILRVILGVAENDGLEEGIRGDNSEHCERGGSEDNGVREESSSVPARSLVDQGRGAKTSAPT